MPFSPGSSFGRYHILSDLGEGGMGAVSLARDTRLNRLVALKRIRSTTSLDASQLGRFEQEARAASALTHPNVAVVYDFGEQDGLPFIAMEYVEGRSLAEHLRGGALSLRDLISAGTQIAEALQAAHAVGIVHRDIKPANVMITSAAQVKVLDFGLAKLTADDRDTGDETRAWATGPHVVVGTTAFMSPEQSIGAAVDHRSDIFSLGVVLYQSATGRLPFAGDTPFATMDLIRHGEPDRVTRLNPVMPEELDRIVQKCLAKAPSARYQSAGELLTDLRILERHGDSGHPALVATRSRHNLPADLTTFVGRGKEVEYLVGLLRSSRLVTLTGAGGSGKTRLAQQVAARVVADYANGAWFVDLAPLADPELLPNVIARALNVPEKAGMRMDATVIEWLRPRQLLMILDNCEHLVDACAAFAESMLRQAPLLKILATSREALSLPGEKVWRVPPLGLPAEDHGLNLDEALAFDAIQLFADRAAAVTSFQLTTENLASVTDICRRLDGVPLAIELAAARTKILSVNQIRERLNDCFRLLAGGGRTAVARQRTLEATVEWSYELLGEPERVLLQRLSVFAGGWTIEAAEQVCGGSGIERDDVLELLARLVDKSLVIVDDSGSEARYRLLETIRQYARNRLVQSGRASAVSNAHLDCFLKLTRSAEVELFGANQATWLNRLDVEHDNLRTALDWSLGEPTRQADGLILANSSWWFWTKRGYLSEGRGHLERALRAQDTIPANLEARVLIGLAHLTTFSGEWAAARDVTDRALVAARESHDEWSESYALSFTAMIDAETGSFARVPELAQQAMQTAKRSTDPQAFQPLGLATRLVGYNALLAGRMDEAGQFFEEAIALIRQHGDVWSTGILLTDLAGFRVLQGRHVEARACAREAFACAQSIRDRRGVGWSLQAIAMLEAAAGRAQRAAWLYGAGETVLESVGATGQMHVTSVQDRYLAPARQALGEEAFRAAANEGRATPVARIMEMDPAAFAAE